MEVEPNSQTRQRQTIRSAATFIHHPFRTITRYENCSYVLTGWLVSKSHHRTIRNEFAN